VSAGNSSVLVVGAGQAGVQLAASLREFGHEGPITLLGDEQHQPYQRPPLSKTGLSAGPVPAALAFRTPEFYADRDIDVVVGTHIAELQTTDGSGIATTDDGRAIAFDRLALATGARARRLRVPGSDLRGVHHLRTVDDAAALHLALKRSGRLVVIGGGFIGLEVAATARSMGWDVHVVLADDRLLNRSVGPVVSEFYLQAHRRRGVTVHLAITPTRFLGAATDAVTGVELADGSVLPADLVVIGIGAQPRTELAERLGLEVADGIVVDAGGLTSDGVTVAAGDCVRCPTPIPGRGPDTVRFEAVNTAIDQAKVAAATITGTPVVRRPPPWFWSDQYDLKLQVAGLSSGADDVVLRGDPADESFTVLYYFQGRLVSADCVNRPTDFLAVKACLSADHDVPKEAAADLGTPLKRSVRPRQPTLQATA
jgi:3-phenylpropionate/trans-cinnamate dioxygenase ferredoxin reductase subunit